MKWNYKLFLAAIILFFLADHVQCQSEEQKVTFISGNPNLPFSTAVQVGKTIYLSGQIGFSSEAGQLVEGGIGPETRQVMQNIKNVLEENGLSLDNVIKCTCMLADIKDWTEMNEEYVKFFPNKKPARSAFATNGLALGARVEIECIAYDNK